MKTTDNEMLLTRDDDGGRVIAWPCAPGNARKCENGCWDMKRRVQPETALKRLVRLAESVGVGPGESAIVRVVRVGQGANL